MSDTVFTDSDDSDDETTDFDLDDTVDMDDEKMRGRTMTTPQFLRSSST